MDSIYESLYSAPNGVGVYIFKNKDNEFIYVGQTRNLFKRCMSYYKNRDSSLKSKAIIDSSSILEFVETKNRQEAIILEKKLIFEHQPKFNKALKDPAAKYLGNVIDEINSKNGKQMMTINIPIDLHEKLKESSKIRNMTMKDIIIYLISQFILNESKFK